MRRSISPLLPAPCCSLLVPGALVGLASRLLPFQSTKACKAVSQLGGGEKVEPEKGGSLTVTVCVCGETPEPVASVKSVYVAVCCRCKCSLCF